MTDTLVIVARLDKAGAGFVSLTESIDTTTAAGRMMVTMLAAFAAFERELTAERTATVLHHKRVNGERTGGIPFGWADQGVGWRQSPRNKRSWRGSPPAGPRA